MVADTDYRRMMSSVEIRSAMPLRRICWKPAWISGASNGLLGHQSLRTTSRSLHVTPHALHAPPARSMPCLWTRPYEPPSPRSGGRGPPVWRAYLARYGAIMSPEQRRALRAIAACRTAALGGHQMQCDHCGHTEIAYNSCRNRHCPKCQGSAQAAWLAAREAELLDVPYFHVVFTLPHTLSPVVLQNPRLSIRACFRPWPIPS